MRQKRMKTFALLAALAGVLSLAGCAKKTAKVTPPPPPAAAPAPTATLAANPSVVRQGQPSILTWQTSNANEITVAGLGTLPPSGSRSVTPSASTTYTLVAKGPGGTTDASARVTVNSAVANATPSPSDEDLFGRTSKMCSSTMTSTQSALTRRQPSKITKPSSSSIQASRFSSKAIVTTVDPRNTTSPSEPAARNRSSERWYRKEFPPIASGPSATARKDRSVPKTTNNAGNRTA